MTSSASTHAQSDRILGKTLTPPASGAMRRHLGEWLMLLAALLSLAGYLGYSQYREHTEIESRERVLLASQATAIEKNLLPHILSARRAIDAILESLPSWRLEKDGFQRTDQRLKIISDSLTGIRAILIIDAKGRVLSSNNRELLGPDFTGREYFQNALKRPKAQTLYVSPPFRTAIHTFVVNLYRIIPGPNGEFAGIVLASLDPEFAATLLDSVGHRPGVSRYVADGEGRLITLAPEKEDRGDTEPAAADSGLALNRNSARPGAVFSGLVDASGDDRLIASRTIQPASLFMDQPLVVAVSRDVAPTFADWRRGSRARGWMFGVLFSVATLSLLFYQRRRAVFAGFSRSKEQALRSSEARLRAFLDATSDALLISDERGVIAMANQQAERLLGYTVEDLLGRSIEDLVPGRLGANDRLLRSGHCAAPGGQAVGSALLVKARRKDGSACDVEIGLSRIPTDQGVFFASALRDMTERNRTEEQLRVAAAAFESQQAMMITDAHQVILRVNRAFAEITGYTAEELVGKSARFLKSGRHSDEFYGAMWEAISSTGGWRGEVWDRRKNGQEYPNWLTISAVKNSDGAVSHYIGTYCDITQRKNAEEKINTLAFFDQLTGLPNRTLLLERLTQAMTASGRNGSHGALLLIDLDNFKTVNDTLGHAVGDLLLKQVAHRLTTCVREGDTVARLGRDEFMVVLAGLSKDESEAGSATEAVAKKFLGTLSQLYQFPDVSHRSTACIGAAVFGSQPTSIDELMKRVDLAMCKAKDGGRNTLRFFDPAMALAVQERAVREADLQAALQANQFLLHYQAQVEGEGRVTGVEALARWPHPQRGMVSPAEFIPLAEETGLILPLGNWVLETACVQLARWAVRPAMAHLTVAVNVSAYQFRQPDFVDRVLAVLENTGANPQRLKLELTESLLVENVPEVIEKMSALKARGVGFSLDDFGIGYSSLSYLRRLPLDQLKIDQSFVRDVLINPNDAAIAKTIVALAQSLGLEVIAEGVETEGQREFLAGQGCHAFQGYLFSHPLPLAEFEAGLTSMQTAMELTYA